MHIFNAVILVGSVEVIILRRDSQGSFIFSTHLAIEAPTSEVQTYRLYGNWSTTLALIKSSTYASDDEQFVASRLV